MCRAPAPRGARGRRSRASRWLPCFFLQIGRRTQVAPAGVLLATVPKECGIREPTAALRTIVQGPARRRAIAALAPAEPIGVLTTHLSAHPCPAPGTQQIRQEVSDGRTMA